MGPPTARHLGEMKQTRSSLARHLSYVNSGSDRVTLDSGEHGVHEVIWSRRAPSPPPKPYGLRSLRPCTDAPSPEMYNAHLAAAMNSERGPSSGANRTKKCTTYSESRAIERAARAAAKEANEERRQAPKKGGMPLAQARDMIRERMQALMMQDRKGMRSVFNQLDRDHKGYLTVSDFRGALSAMGVDLNRDEAKKVMGKFCTKNNVMTFDDFVLKFLGLPPDFFTMDLMKADGAVDSMQEGGSGGGGPPKSLRPVNPASTPYETVEKLFRTRLRKRLFNIDGAIINGLKRQSQTDKDMTEDMLFNTVRANGVTCTRKQIVEIMNYFDQNRDGRVDYLELAHELLQLPRPGHVRHIMPYYPTRPAVGTVSKAIIRKLAINCERAAAPPARIYSLFKSFDKDGSGSISYDEIEAMVREFGCEVEGMNAAALLLDAFTKGKGSMSYMEFVTNVIGLQPDALREQPGSTTPATPEILNKFNESLKEKVFGNKACRDKAFVLFDKDKGGSITLPEFRRGVHEMGLPVSKKQVEQLFREFDQGGTGSLDMMTFTRDLMGMDRQKTAAPKTQFSSRSRGGAPSMPKEFRVPTARRPKTSLDGEEPSLEFHSPAHAQSRSHSVNEIPSERRRLNSSSGSQIMILDHDDDDVHPAKRSSRRGSPLKSTSTPPRMLPGLSASKSPPLMSSTLRAPSTGSISTASLIPTHRRKNMQTKIGGNYQGNFFVADGGLEANFSPEQINSITKKQFGGDVSDRRSAWNEGSPLKSSRSRGSGHNMLSNQRALPAFQLSATLGPSHAGE